MGQSNSFPDKAVGTMPPFNEYRSIAIDFVLLFDIILNLTECITYELQLASVDVVGALDMYIEKGQWEKCIETAASHVTITYFFTL